MKYVEIKDDLVITITDVDPGTGIIVPKYLENIPVKYLRYDGNKIVDVRMYNTFYIDSRGTKHIIQVDPNWQKIVCSFDDQLQFDTTQNKWVVVYDQEEMDLARAQAQELASQRLKNYIEQHYPDIKQKSDIVDKEYFGTYLLAFARANNIQLTEDTLRVLIFEQVQQILNNTVDLPTAINNIISNIFNTLTTPMPPEINIAIEQLLKVALRVAFVEQCKTIYRQFTQALQNADSPTHCFVLVEEYLDEANLPKLAF